MIRTWDNVHRILSSTELKKIFFSNKRIQNECFYLLFISYDSHSWKNEDNSSDVNSAVTEALPPPLKDLLQTFCRTSCRWITTIPHFEWWLKLSTYSWIQILDHRWIQDKIPGNDKLWVDSRSNHDELQMVPR